ncbi:MAG: hypothetical protein ABIH11_00825 [Candidatus Altiarchaeota archaeon]
MKPEIEYKSLEAKQYGTGGEPASINNNSTLTKVLGEGKYLNVGFIFSCNYEPNVGVIRIEGDLRLDESEDNVKRAMDEWNTSGHKKLPKDIAEKVHNTILSNCVLEASILARDVKLPVPLPVPHVQIGSESTKETQSYIR